MRIKLILVLLICVILFAPWLVAFGKDEITNVQFDSSKTFTDWQPMTILKLSSQSANPAVVAINIINTALAFLGMASAAMILYAGLLWFLARDNEEQVKKATDIIKGAVIGLALVLLSYGISFALWKILYLSTSMPSS